MADKSAPVEDKYPARAHCAKVADFLRERGASEDGMIFLEGARQTLWEDSDCDAPFRQRRPFFYLSGYPGPGAALAYDLARRHLTLLIPPLSPSAVMWSGLPLAPAEALTRYDVDAVLTTDQLPDLLPVPPAVPTTPRPASAHGAPAGCVYGIAGQLPDEVAECFKSSDTAFVVEAITRLRVVKDAHEIALIRRANVVTAAAHTALLRAVGSARSERNLQAVFRAQCIAVDCPEEPYSGIFASGTHAATLHYVRNDAALDRAQPDLLQQKGVWDGGNGGKPLNVLVDAAAEERCYAADVTRTLPLSGTFSRESREIYNMVHEMQEACLRQLSAGMRWERLHELAHRTAIAGLQRLGILRSAPALSAAAAQECERLGPEQIAEAAEQIFAARTSCAFFPHGLGHYMGLDVHDVGGNPDYADPDPMFKYLRVRGEVPAGAVITVEPGVYFCRFIIEPYLREEKHRKWIDEEVLARYWAVGGVRIEDDVLITDGGFENLTTAIKDVDEMERIIRGA